MRSGKSLGTGCPGIEVPPRQADHAQRHHAQAVDAPAEGHYLFLGGHDFPPSIANAITRPSSHGAMLAALLSA